MAQRQATKPERHTDDCYLAFYRALPLSIVYQLNGDSRAEIKRLLDRQRWRYAEVSEGLDRAIEFFDYNPFGLTEEEHQRLLAMRRRLDLTQAVIEGDATRSIFGSRQDGAVTNRTTVAVQNPFHPYPPNDTSKRALMEYWEGFSEDRHFLEGRLHEKCRERGELLVGHEELRKLTSKKRRPATLLVCRLLWVEAEINAIGKALGRDVFAPLPKFNLNLVSACSGRRKSKLSP